MSDLVRKVDYLLDHHQSEFVTVLIDKYDILPYIIPLHRNYGRYTGITLFVCDARLGKNGSVT